jgi:hypothetical protein
MDIPFPNMPEFADKIVYMSAVGSIIVGLMLVGWGRLWSRPLMGLAGVGVGFVIGDLVSGTMDVDPWVARSAVGSILGVLGFVAAPLFWAVILGALCSSSAGGFLVGKFLIEEGIKVEAPAGGFTPELWAEWLSVAAGDVSGAMWKERAGVLILVMAPAGLIPLLIGLWRQRFATIVMTSLIGAIAVVGGACVATVQSSPERWPKEWLGLLTPLYIAGGLWFCGMVMQYCFVLASTKKKKAKEAAQAESEEPSGRRK